MEAVALTNHELEIEDVEYLRHGDTPYLLRLLKPAGDGPFPLIVQLHGGAWCRGDRANESPKGALYRPRGHVRGDIIHSRPLFVPHTTEPRVYVGATHAVFCGDAVHKLAHCGADGIVITDTVPLHEPLPDGFQSRSVAALLARAIKAIHHSESVSALFEKV